MRCKLLLVGTPLGHLGCQKQAKELSNLARWQGLTEHS